MPSKFEYIDVHCHVNLPQYDTDMEAVISRAREAGVGMIAVGTDPASSQSAVELAEKYENVWAIVGTHPSDTGRGLPFDYDAYKKMAVHPKVVGIGECGLDYFHAAPAENRILQKKVFEDQIRLAHEAAKPLMLHVRNGRAENGQTAGCADAYADVIEILKNSRDAGMSIKGDVHFFAGGPEYARRFIDLGLYLSFTGVITFAEEYHEVIGMMPLDRIMSETDTPFVTPVPYRGKRNEPAYVILVAKAIAEIRRRRNSAESEEIVLKALVNNAKNLFNI